MRTPPADLESAALRAELAGGWGIDASWLNYVPEGGGSHHWVLTDQAGRHHFVTVDDLDDKDWLGDTRAEVYAGLDAALRTAQQLRDAAHLDFVVAPVATLAGEVLRRLGPRYAASVFPFLAGCSYPFGPYLDAGLRDAAFDMVIDLHQSTPAVRDRAPRHALGFGGQRDLHAFLHEPARPWTGGTDSEPARRVLTGRLAEVSELVAGFDRLADLTAPARETMVITHGEPHPANLMSVNGRVVIVDWDTVALAPPERDIALMATTHDAATDRYGTATGHEVDFDVVTLYRLRWYLDDLASAARLFRNPHEMSVDLQRWWESFMPRLEQLPTWLGLVG